MNAFVYLFFLSLNWKIVFILGTREKTVRMESKILSLFSNFSIVVVH